MKPLGNNVLIKPDVPAEKSGGGLFLPEQSREKPQEGTVVALGTGGRDDKGKLVPFDVKVGDKVLVAKYGGVEITHDGHKCKIVNAEDLLAIIT